MSTWITLWSFWLFFDRSECKQIPLLQRTEIQKIRASQVRGLSGTVQDFRRGLLLPILSDMLHKLKDKKQKNQESSHTQTFGTKRRQNPSPFSSVLLPVSFFSLARWLGGLFCSSKDYSHVHSHSSQVWGMLAGKSSTPVSPFPHLAFLFTSASQAAILC